MLSRGRGGVTPLLFLKLQESWSKRGYAAREMITIYFVAFFISNSILVLLVVGQIVKTPPPLLLQKVSRHISAKRQWASFVIVMQNM